MKCYVQWLKAVETAWEEFDSKDWRSLAKKGMPPTDRQPIFDGAGEVVGFTGTPLTVDDTPGWPHRVCVHGQTIAADHLAVRDRPGYVEVLGWNDDPDDWGGPENFHGSLWKFYPEIIDVTYNLPNGQLRCQGPRQELQLFLGSAVKADWEARGILPMWTSGGQAVVQVWENWPGPPAQFVKHGIWILQTNLAPLDAVAVPPWSDWF